MSLKILKSEWEDTEEYHKEIKDTFEAMVNYIPKLKEHRDFVENGFGFGERAFWRAWYLILDEISTEKPKLLEIGVYKGATLSLWRLLSPVAAIYGITPLNTTGDYPEFDYKADIEAIHNHFNQPQPFIHVGLSQDSRVLKAAYLTGPYDVVYIDGDHSAFGCLFDLTHYSKMVADNGFLVIDDACTDMRMPFGFFQGHGDVTLATLEFMKEHGNDWEFLFNVVHLRVYRKK